MNIWYSLQVAFRAKVGKRYQLPHKGIIPEEFGPVYHLLIKIGTLHYIDFISFVETVTFHCNHIPFFLKLWFIF